jgi:LCP family protein required for cell wall assembly
MREPGEEDAGVLVGGDAYGGVKLAPVRTRRPLRSAKARRRNVLIAGFLSTCVLVTTGVVWATPRQIGTVDAGVTASSSRGAENILLVGVDKRDDLTRQQQNRLKLGRESGQRTDTMMVIHLSEDHRKVTVVSLPRDTWATIPGKGDHKINSAYQFGGPKLARQTVESVTGLQINRYIEVNILGFIDVVDSLGGVTVCTPVPINDQRIALNLPAGTHKLDGVQALGYARTRATARSDLDRIDRQQQVISALLNRALSAGTLANPGTLASFVNSTLSTVKVDPDDGLIGLATQLRDVSLEDVRFAEVPLADVDYETPTGESAVLWDKGAARDMFARIDAAHPVGRRGGVGRAVSHPAGEGLAQDQERHADQRSRRAHQGGAGRVRVQGARPAGKHPAARLREDRRAPRQGPGGRRAGGGRRHPRVRAARGGHRRHRADSRQRPAEGPEEGVEIHADRQAGRYTIHQNGNAEHM